MFGAARGGGSIPRATCNSRFGLEQGQSRGSREATTGQPEPPRRGSTSRTDGLSHAREASGQEAEPKGMPEDPGRRGSIVRKENRREPDALQSVPENRSSRQPRTEPERFVVGA